MNTASLLIGIARNTGYANDCLFIWTTAGSLGAFAHLAGLSCPFRGLCTVSDSLSREVYSDGVPEDLRGLDT